MKTRRQRNHFGNSSKTYRPASIRRVRLILIGTYLQTQLGEPGIETGIIRVEANPLAFGVAGYALRKTDDYGPNVAEVYWLPWQDGAATVAARQAYEDKADCFFMTTSLTGCRFSVDQDLVVHTAHSAGFNSAGRTHTEEGMTGGRTPHTRRLSVSLPTNPNDKRYGGNLIGAYIRALVFGMKIQAQYSYKGASHESCAGTWETIL